MVLDREVKEKSEADFHNNVLYTFSITAKESTGNANRDDMVSMATIRRSAMPFFPLSDVRVSTSDHQNYTLSVFRPTISRYQPLSNARENFIDSLQRLNYEVMEVPK